MSKIIISDTKKRNVTINIQSDYTNKKFNHISISCKLKDLPNNENYNVIVISIDELKKICKEVF